MRKIFALCVMILFYPVAIAQNKISGTIYDQHHMPLAGTTVFIPDMNKGTYSDEDGHYELLNLPDGKIQLQFSFIGYANRIETIQLNGKSVVLDISLQETAIEAEAIVVSGGYNSTQHENAVKIDILTLNSMQIINTPNFTEMLTRVPGVDMISKGSGISKPVIRGLSMNDILVLNHGVRFENYQYSSHHPLGIDEFGIEEVEMIKGPASLLYGSDAIGGVINFIKEKPAPIGHIIGDYNMQLFSNTRGVSNNLGIRGASKKFFGGFRAGQKSNADYLQGGGEFVPNSRFNEVSAKANAGFTDKIGTFNLYYDYNHQKLGLTEDEAIEAITERGRKNEIWYQEFKTHLLSSRNKLYLGNFKMDLNSAYQNTALIHFADLNVYELQMQLETLTYEAKLHLPSKEGSEYIVGFQGINQKNKNLHDRETLLLPDAHINNYSAFTLLQFAFFHPLKVQTGIRYDHKYISTVAIGLPDHSETYRPSLEKSFGSFSGSLGATYYYSENLLFRANFAAAYRTPNLAELTSNGPHELRYEIGDHHLVPEKAWESDLSIHYHTDHYTIDLAGFYNIVNDYIFIAPTGETTVSGMGIYRYRQANSFLYGGEAGFHFHPESLEWLHLETTFSTVVGKLKGGGYLPFVPAHKLRLELRAEKNKLLFMQRVFASAVTTTAFDQNRTAMEETVTPGYTLLDLSIGFNLKMGNQDITLSLNANNVLDRKYTDHLSTLKEVNLYNPGRNISVNLKIPFTITGK